MSAENKKTSIKGSKDGMKIFSAVAVFALTAIIGIVIRSIQTFRFIDPKTGFYTGGEFLAVILYAAIVIAMLYFCGISFFSSDNKKIELGGSVNKIAALGARLFAISLIGDFYYCVSTGIYNTGTSGAGYADIMKSGLLPLLIQSVSALVSAVYFFILGSDFAKGTAKAYKRKFIATAPVLWAGARLIYRFLRQISFVQVSDLFLELIMIAFMIMFFMALAQTSSGVYKDTFKWRIPAFGLSAALIAAVTSVPRMIVAVTAREFVNRTYPFSLNDFIFVIFILTLMVKIKEDAKRPATSAVYEEKAE
jgi:hypothetical protein